MPSINNDLCDMKSHLKTTIKLVMLLAVAIGLTVSVKKASRQWQEERVKVSSLIQETEEKLRGELDGEVRSRLIKRRESLRQAAPEWHNLDHTYLFAAALFYGMGLLPSGFILHFAVQGFGFRPNLGLSIAAQTLGHVGKYVPGKALVVVLRAAMLGRGGIPVREASLSVFVETFLMMAVGGGISFAILYWLPLPGWILWLAVVAAIGCSIPTFPPFLDRIVVKLSRKRESLGEFECQSDGDEKEKLLSISQESICKGSRSFSSYKVFVLGWLFSIFTWVLFGFSFACIVKAIPALEPIPLTLQLFAICTAAISLAVVAGFASLLPGGAGVRELVLATVLGMILTPSHGLLAAIVARLVHLFTEVLLAVLSWLWLRLRYPKGS